MDRHHDMDDITAHKHHQMIQVYKPGDQDNIEE